MIDNDIVESLRKRYFYVHPLVFYRSLEKAKTQGDLFDILENMPKDFPICWDDDNHSWMETNDLLQYKQFFFASETDDKKGF